ncbi:thiamine diphosphokinase [Liquorilactobacillus sicerae]|uniref:thiamine diphosphokinase n=1 Tax=Liquorilactobacillus sicerae TaxID=1416943 RepID=UPI002480CD6A|nr:thiamine diphosphokinase [Liquorilactobacillus sicerae]
MEINLLVGGPVKNWPKDLLGKKKAAVWAGADRGALYLVQNGIQPLLAIGDFDSATSMERKLIFAKSQRVITDQPEKDDTDTELAVRHLLTDYQAARINIYGATGGRIDHLLANLFFVIRPEFRSHLQQIFLFDRQNSISFFNPGHYIIKRETDKKYLAFVLLTSVAKLSLYDEKYQLAGKSFTYPISLASNEFIGQTASFSFASGVVGVIQSKDLN